MWQREARMPDTIKGRVREIINGDMIEVEIEEIFSENPDQYEDTERVVVANLSEEEEYTDSEDLDCEEDEEESTRTPEEASIEMAEYSPTQFYGIRSREDLEARMLGRQVMCEVKDRNDNAELVADVTVL
jgi:endonuclease YncB( thermonuclease family)